MGSFNLTCSLSGKVISSETETVVLMLTQKQSYSSLGVYSWDHFSPTPIFLEGKYNSYGGLKDVKIFDSLEKINQKGKKQAEKILLNFFETNLLQDDEKITSLNEVVGTQTEIIKFNLDKKIIKSHLNMLADENITEDLAKLIEQLIIDLGFKDQVEAKSFCENSEDILNKKPVNFIFFDKAVLKKFLNNYGSEFKDEENDDIYAQTIQKARHGLESSKEIVDVVSGGNYAGANHPSFTFHKILKNTQEKDKGALNECYIQHGLDLALINDYFSILGKPWMPSITVNENIENYGHNEAMKMQNLITHDSFISNENKKVKIIKKIR